MRSGVPRVASDCKLGIPYPRHPPASHAGSAAQAATGPPGTCPGLSIWGPSEFLGDDTQFGLTSLCPTPYPSCSVGASPGWLLLMERGTHAAGSRSVLGDPQPFTAVPMSHRTSAPPGETGGVGAISSPTDQDRQGGQGVSPRDLQMEWSGETGTSQPWPHPHPHILPGPGRAGCPAGDELPLSSHSRHSALLPQDEASLLAPDRQRAKSSGPGPAGLVKNCFLPLKEYFKFF